MVRGNRCLTRCARTAQMYFRPETHLHCSASFVAFRIFYYFRKALVFSASNRRWWGSGAFFLRPAVQVHGFVIGGRFRFLLRANVFLTRNSSPLQGFLLLTCQALSSHGGFISYLLTSKKRMDARLSSLKNCYAVLQYPRKSMDGFSWVIRRHGAPLVPRQRYEPNRRRAERRWRRGMGGRISRGAGW